jgi:hypothetical protein
MHVANDPVLFTTGNVAGAGGKGNIQEHLPNIESTAIRVGGG